MKDRLLVVAASGEVLEGARIFPHEVASNERGAKRERGARSSNDPISSSDVENMVVEDGSISINVR
jgi:hypothetical protein